MQRVKPGPTDRKEPDGQQPSAQDVLLPTAGQRAQESTRRDASTTLRKPLKHWHEDVAVDDELSGHEGAGRRLGEGIADGSGEAEAGGDHGGLQEEPVAVLIC